MPRHRGFSYLMVLLWVAISGVMLMALSRAWLLESRRERDTELIYRGEQIREALSAYAAVPVSTGRSRAPASTSPPKPIFSSAAGVISSVGDDDL